MSETGGTGPAPDGAPDGWGPPPQGRPGYGQPDQPGQPAPPQYGQYGQPQYGQYGQPQYGQPQYGGPPYGMPPQYGAPPPAKPGIVPLRPLSLGEIFDGTFGAIRHNPKIMVGLSALVVTIASVLAALVGYVIAQAAISEAWWNDNIVDTDVSLFWTFDSPGEFGAAVGPLLIMELAAPVVTGLLTYSVSRSVIGHRASVAETWHAIRGRIWFLIGFPLLLGLGWAVLATAFVFAVVGLFAVNTGLGVLGVFLALAGFAVIAVWVGTRTALVPSALALEGEPFWRTIGRGWRLTRGVFWRLFGIYLLAYVAMSVISNVLNVPIALITENIDSPAVFWTVDTLWSVVIQLIQTLFMAGVVSLLYIDTRMRREGLDVELQAATQEAVE